MKNNIITLFLLHLVVFGFAQSSSTSELNFEVKNVYPPLSITKETLNKANSIVDLNRHFKSSWIKEYESVEILTSHNGKINKTVSNNDVFSDDQKNKMKTADVNTDISIKVRYLPDNTLKHNDIKEFKFSFLVNPDNDAKFSGGEQELKSYLQTNAIDKIPDGTFEGLDLATIKFKIDEEGKVTDANAFWPFKDEKIVELLLETIRNMPNWKPAEYANGTRVTQEFALTVGNQENCVINLLNTRKE